jgi:hypothetical protein
MTKIENIICLIAGGILVFVGVWQIYPPAALIVAGGAFLLNMVRRP